MSVQYDSSMMMVAVFFLLFAATMFFLVLMAHCLDNKNLEKHLLFRGMNERLLKTAFYLFWLVSIVIWSVSLFVFFS